MLRVFGRLTRPSIAGPSSIRCATTVATAEPVESSVVEQDNEPWPSEEETFDVIDQLSTKPTGRTPNSSTWTANESTDTLYIQLNNLVPRKEGQPRASRNVVSLLPSVFHHPLRTDILHSCVVWHLDGLRKGLAKSKSRYEVSASNHKLRPQKGSGRARLRDAGSPMLRGGGRAWPKIPRDFSTKLNRKVRDMGMRVVLSAKLREHNLEVVPTIRGWTSFKTAELQRRLKVKGWGDDRTLLVVGGDVVPKNLELATRNLQDTHIVLAKDLSVYAALWWKRLILDVEAVDYFSQWLGKEDDFIGDHELMSDFASSLTPRSVLKAPVGSLLPLHHYSPLYSAYSA